MRWSIETETSIRHTSLSRSVGARTSSRAGGGFIDAGQRPSIRGQTGAINVSNAILQSCYAACFSVMIGRCFLPCRNPIWMCTALRVDFMGALQIGIVDPAHSLTQARFPSPELLFDGLAGQ